MNEHDAEALIRLNAIGVLTRREIEARLLGPLLSALSKELGAERVLEITRQTIIEIAHTQGAQLAQTIGGCSLLHLAASLEAWKKDDAMEIEFLEQNEQRLSFNVTRAYDEARGIERPAGTLGFVVARRFLRQCR